MRIDKVATGSYKWAMRRVGIKELKNNLSRYVHQAAAGETILVTDRNCVVAELIAPRIDEGLTPAEREFQAMVRGGVITPPRVARGTPLPERHPTISFEEMMEGLDWSRGDR